MTGCPFCYSKTTSDDFHVRLDSYPISPGHTLVIPNAHIASIYDLPPKTQSKLWETVAATRAALMKSHAPDAFTIGINDGAAAGQTIEHAHIHIIPRYEGDVEDPRGGVRWVIPDAAPYWEDA